MNDDWLTPWQRNSTTTNGSFLAVQLRHLDFDFSSSTTTNTIDYAGVGMQMLVHARSKEVNDDGPTKFSSSHKVPATMARTSLAENLAKVLRQGILCFRK